MLNISSIRAGLWHKLQPGGGEADLLPGSREDDWPGQTGWWPLAAGDWDYRDFGFLSVQSGIYVQRTDFTSAFLNFLNFHTTP